MTKKLTTHNAEITTATVEVKTLTISGKQVTQAVFRQLQEADVVDSAEGVFLGIPWGVVNYHPNKCADQDEHLHVVWQQGAELRRAYEVPMKFGPIHTDTAEAWLDAAVLDGWQTRDDFSESAIRPHFVRVEYLAGVVEIHVDSVMQDALWPHSYYPAEEKEAHRERQRSAALDKIRKRSSGDRNELMEIVAEEIRDEVAWRKRHQDRWAELKALPQLFIAV